MRGFVPDIRRSEKQLPSHLALDRKVPLLRIRRVNVQGQSVELTGGNEGHIVRRRKRQREWIATGNGRIGSGEASRGAGE